MLDKLRSFLESAFAGPGENGSSDPDAHEDALRIATAALLVEMSRADQSAADGERATILHLLSRDFSLASDEAHALLDAAQDEADAAVSLHEFTALLHRHLDEADKLRVVEMLWQVALADRRIDKYEDYLVRKVADLLYVDNKDVLRLRHRVRSAQAQTRRITD